MRGFAVLEPATSCTDMVYKTYKIDVYYMNLFFLFTVPAQVFESAIKDVHVQQQKYVLPQRIYNRKVRAAKLIIDTLSMGMC